MSNEVSNLEKHLKLVFSKTFFFAAPTNQKVFLYSLLYILFLIAGILMDIWLITSIFIVFPLTYIIGARGYYFYIPMALLGLGITFTFGNIYMMFWTTIHILIALIIYLALINRYSKLLLLNYISAFIVFSCAIFTFILIKYNYINYSPDAIQNFINNYIVTLKNMNPNSVNLDTELLHKSFEEIKIFFPIILFANSLIYSLVLLQYTLTALGREKVIIPIFPKFGIITIPAITGYVYMLLLFVLYYLTTSANYTRFDMWNIIIENIIGIVRWIIVFNGLFTCYYFLDSNKEKSSLFSKIVLFILMYLFSFIFEIIGLFDCILKLRENYEKYKKGGM